MKPLKLKPPRVLERDFQRSVIDLARLHRWRVAHFRAAQNAAGKWRTPVAADGAGFPDLVLAHDRGMLIFAELKTDAGRLSEGQEQWLAMLQAAASGLSRVRVEVWRPRDWDRVAYCLTKWVAS